MSRNDRSHREAPSSALPKYGMLREKLMWGYEAVSPNPQEAFRFYRQAADLGFSDAMIRMGELLEHGKGIAQNANDALIQYQKAAKAGNFLGWGFMARLLSRTKHYPKAEAYWAVFFGALEERREPRFLAENLLKQLNLGVRTEMVEQVVIDPDWFSKM